MKKALLLLAAFFSFASSFSGSRDNCDCDSATGLTFSAIYHVYNASPGYGLVKEFQNNLNSLHFFENEHHSSWYFFRAPADGILTMDIIPEDSKDDYDFLVYKGPNPCKAISDRKLLPLRGNIARNDLRLNGKTGLAEGYTNDFALPGPGLSYSKPLPVKKDELFYLVLDNVYGRSGHTIKFALKELSPEEKYTRLTKIDLEGRITDEEGTPLQAKLTIEDDATGTAITETWSDSLGAYSIRLPAVALNVTVEKEGFLYKSENYTPDTALVNRVDFRLDSAKVGNSIRFYNMHFSPNEATLLPNSIPDLDRLVRFMKKYPKFMVEIQGHSNHNLFSDRNFLFQLSMERARTVSAYLVQKGIDGARINIRGFGGSKPLIISDDTTEAMKNLRVEVLLFDESSQPE